MAGGGGPAAALAIVKLASRLVSPHLRNQWRSEWEGELHARWDQLRAEGGPDLGARWNLVWRASGSVVDAWVYGNGRGTMEGFGQDLGVAVRSLARRPGLTAVVVGTLALGIGANTAMFSIASDVLLRPFPYPDPEQVVTVENVRSENPGAAGNVGYPNIHDLDRTASTLADVGAVRIWDPALEDERGATVLRGATVTSNYFRILGIEAGAGRFFDLDEQGVGREPLVVLSYDFWVTGLGADPSVVGRDLVLNGSPYTVIGVTAADFEDPWLMDGPGEEPQVFRTVSSGPDEWPRSGRSWKGIARLADGVSLATAQEEVDGLYAGLAERYPDHNAQRLMRLVPLKDRIAGPSEPVLVALLSAVAMLLLIACANIANLMIGRALDRQGEFAVHTALGASRWRLFNRGIAEAMVLTVLGAGLGVGLALWLVGAAPSLESVLPRPVSGRLDLPVLTFALVSAVGAGLLFGIAPAVHGARAGSSLPGREGGRSTTLGRKGQRLRRTLIVGQLALTTALLIGAGLLGRSFQKLGAVDLGFETEGVIAFQLHGSAWFDRSQEESQVFWDRIMAAVRAVPGVESAGAIDIVPLSGSYSCDGVRRDDRPPPGPGEGMCAETRMTLAGAEGTLGVPLVRGRLLAPTDVAGSPPVVVIDQTLHQRLWPDEDPIGRPLVVHGNVHEVVGVVENILHFGADGDAPPQLYLSAPQDGWNGIARGLTVLVRGSDPAALVGPVRSAIQGVSPAIAIASVETLEGYLATSVRAERFRVGLMVAFALIALLLALLGIAGVMSYSVARRRREIGVRLALGARPGAVRNRVLGEGVRLGGFGIGAGVLVAVLFAGRLEALLFGVGSIDVVVYVGVVSILALATAVACYLPARRASRVDPVSALSEE